MMAAAREKLPERFPDLNWRFEVPWGAVTTLGAGSTPVPLMLDAENDVELSEVLAFCRTENIAFSVIGGGSNICGCDCKLDRLLIRIASGEFIKCRAAGEYFTAAAGIRLAELARKAAEHGFGGLAPLCGIPGTLGGALRMNAGANGAEIGSLVNQVCGLHSDGSPYTADGSEIEWGYRCSSIPDDVLITAVRLALPAADTDESAKIQSELSRRRTNEPKGRSAGCTFRNISATESAGRLIDEAGLKGMRCGDLEISMQHGNYIINRGTASEAEYLELLGRITESVAEKTGFYLQPEVRFANPRSAVLLREKSSAPHVAVLKGGISNEREISLRSGAAVANALRNAGYRVSEIDVKSCEIMPEMRQCDVVYPLLHGGFGEDGTIQRLFEESGIAFVGSGSAASRLVMDKIATKKLLDRSGIPTAKWRIITPEHPEIPAELKFPVVLKAPNEGSSFGIIKVDSPAEWDEALRREFEFADEILAEEFIEGMEITVPVLDGKTMPVVEVVPANGFYDFDAKYVYNNGKTCYFCPARAVEPELEKKINEYTLRFFEAAGCKDILRVDFIIGKDDRIPYVLEGNSLPGCTATSLVPKAAAAVGISFEKFTSALVQANLKK